MEQNIEQTQNNEEQAAKQLFEQKTEEKKQSENGQAKVTKDMTIGDVVKRFPAAAEIMLSYGLHCVGCHVNPFESIEMGAKGHGMPDETINEMIAKINEIVAAPVDEKLELTPIAAKKIITLAKSENKEGQALRIKVVPGGCSGFSYDMHFDENIGDDKVFEKDGAKIVVDKDSLNHLKGTTIDYVEGLQGAGFKLLNPNAKSACGCGSSVGF